MNGNIDGANMHVNNPLNFRLRKICKGNIITEKKGQTGVIILEIYTLPHTLGILIYEAEDAFVFAGLLFVHQRGCKFKTDLKIVFLLAEAEIF